MANLLGNNGEVTVAGTAVVNLLDFSWDSGVAIVDNTPLGATADTHLVGTVNHNGSMNCLFDSADTTGQEACTIGASLAIIWLPEGDTVGKPSYTSTATISSVGIAVAKNTVITRSFGLTINGDITIGTVSI